MLKEQDPMMTENTVSMMNTDSDLTPVYRSSNFFAPELFFYKRTGKLPNTTDWKGVDHELLSENLEKEFGLDRKNALVSRSYDEEKGSYQIHSMYWMLDEDSMLAFENMRRDTVVILHYSHDMPEEKLKKLNGIIESSVVTNRDKGKISLLVLDKEFGGFGLEEFTIPDPGIKLETHYNEDLMPVHETISANLESGRGIILLHGLPGTGKTTYIRHLLQQVNRRVIYIPPDLAKQIADPSFMQFLIKKKGSLLVIEDAEELLLERNEISGNVISNLLNLGDGLLSDCLDIQVICTFNTRISKIDKALLRKGRVIARYEFGKLTVDRCNDLLKELDAGYTTTEEMTVADVYHHSDRTYDLVKKEKIGFN